MAINMYMKHFIYKTTHINGRYYIGRHSTDNLNDGYFGSGRWPSSIKDKTSLTREILEYADSQELLKKLETKYLSEHYNKPLCMNMSSSACGFDTNSNPMKNPEIADKISGDNHWMVKAPKRNHMNFPELVNKIKGENHWMKKDPVRALNNVFYTNNPSTRLAKEGKHHLQGPEHNLRRVAEGTNPFSGSTQNQKMLKSGTHPSQQKKTCNHCRKEVSIGMYARWHGNNCKLKDNK